MNVGRVACGNNCGAPGDTPHIRNIAMFNVLSEPAKNGNEHAGFSSKEINKSKRILERLLARGSKNLFTETIVITPELASLILQLNPQDENRKVSQRAVDIYASDMVGGRWRGLNGQSIVISSDGYLNDGQHRLNAIIQSEVPILTNVTFGVDRESRLTLDQNKIRTNGDYLHMQGFRNANLVAAISTTLIKYERGILRSSRFNPDNGPKPTKSEIHDYAVEHISEIEDSLKFVSADKQSLPCTPSHIAAAKILISRISRDVDEVSSFIKQVCYGENITKQSPAYHVRNRIQNERLSGVLRPGTTLEIIFRGWNALRKSGRMTRLAVTREIPDIEA